MSDLLAASLDLPAPLATRAADALIKGLEALLEALHGPGGIGEHCHHD